MKSFVLIIASAATLMSAGPRASAMPVAPAIDVAPITNVADGCGQGRYRGPGGACHWYGRGPYPNGFYEPGPAFFAPPVYAGNGCPQGWWRGPWGHCRNTPYHGRLPGGGWQ